MSEHRVGASRHLRTVFEAGALGLLTDGQLLERFLAGRGDEDSAAAFAALAERHGPMVLSVCLAALGGLHDAEDAAQATFLILAMRAASIRRAESLASWLFGVALKVSSKARAKAARRRTIERRGAEMRAESAGSDLTPETRAGVHEELDRLPERFRAPIVLCHLEGLTTEQAASRLGLPVRTVQRRLAEGRERLRHRLTRLGLAPASGALALGPVAETVSESWIEATVQAAAGLAAGRAVGAVASAPVAALVRASTIAVSRGRWMAIAAGLAIAGTIAMTGFGALLAAKPRAQAPPRTDRAARSAPPPVANVGPWIRGIVVDDRGRPVAGARVSSLWAVSPRPVTAKADGTFALPTDEPRLANHALIATADGGARQGTFRFDGPSGYKGPRTLARIVLRPAQDVVVTVVDGRGTPVPDADVFVLDLVFPVAQGKTDARGIVRLRAPVDAMTMWIVGARPGAGFDYFENYRSFPPIAWSPPPKTARLVLDGARTVRVRAVDSAGRPVPGFQCYPLTIQKKGKFRSVNLSPLLIDARTDANGVATFDWLPADLLYGTSFHGASPSYYLAEPPTLDASKPQAELTARVLRPTRVSGKVIGPDGSPVAGILVEAEGVGSPRLPGASGRARTAADGTYTMELAPEHSYMIGVIDDEHAARALDGVVVREGVPLHGLDLVLERPALIWGRVTVGDAASPSPGRPVVLNTHGKAVPPATFKDQPPGPIFNVFTRIADTDEDGRYAFRVAPGLYALRGPVVPDGPKGVAELKVDAGQEIERDFHLPRDDRPWKTVRGVVRSGRPDGPPVANAILVVASIEGRSDAHGNADDRGRFELPCPVGKALITARNPEGSLAGYAAVDNDGAREFAIVAGPAATARGRVVDEDGKPWASVSVAYSVLVAVDGNDAVAYQEVLTDDDGRFAAPGLPVGARCEFQASSPRGGNWPSRRMEVKDTRPFEVPPLVIDRARPRPSAPSPR